VAWILVLLLHLGVVTTMVCLIGYMVLLAAVFAWRFRSGAWRRIQLLEPDAGR
jgi:hypothetical protein